MLSTVQRHDSWDDHGAARCSHSSRSCWSLPPRLPQYNLFWGNHFNETLPAQPTSPSIASVSFLVPSDFLFPSTTNNTLPCRQPILLSNNLQYFLSDISIAMSSDRPLDGLMKAEEGDTSHTAFGASCNYQRHYDETDNHNNNTSNNNKDATASMSSRSWRFTDFGAHVESESSGLPQLSRDGSIHVTDEVFNSASHLAATLLSLLGSVLLIVESSSMANPWKIVSFSIYGASLLFLFSMSTLHHAISGHERIVNFLRYKEFNRFHIPYFIISWKRIIMSHQVSAFFL